MNYEQMNNNKVYVYGEIVSDAVFSHEVYGEGFYDMFIKVERLSSQCDVLPITISERILKEENIKCGDFVALKGQFRSYNKQVDGKSKLALTIFVREIIPKIDNAPTNLIELAGFVCKEPIYRTTPFNREISDVLLAVNRAYNKSDYIPCIAWGRNARFVKSIDVGEKVVIQGRIQSRQYQKKLDDETIENKVAYEISISKITLNSNEVEIGESNVFVS